MGKGDQRSRRGKIHRGTFGKRRPKPKLHAGAKPDAAAQGGAAAKEKTPKVVKKPATE